MMIDEIHKNRGHKIKSQKGKANRRNSIRGTQRFTKPSPTVGDANVQINSETAIPLLEKLKQKYIGTCNPYGFINDLRDALGIPTSKGSSKYGVVQIPTDNGVLESSICITNHNANAENYITYGCNLPYNLRLLIRKEFQINRFHPHKDVKLDEYVYYAKRMQKVENPLCQIIDSLINFLKTGQYKDTTGVAFLNQSPSTEIENNQNINCNRNMNKKLVRLTESDLHRIVKESVNRVLRESTYPRIRINESFEDGLDAIEWLSQYVNDGDVFTAGRTEDGTVLKVKFDDIEMALQDGDADELSIEFSNGYIEENPIGFIKEIRHFMGNGNNFESALRKCIYADSR